MTMKVELGSGAGGMRKQGLLSWLLIGTGMAQVILKRDGANMSHRLQGFVLRKW